MTFCREENPFDQQHLASAQLSRNENRAQNNQRQGAPKNVYGVTTLVVFGTTVKTFEKPSDEILCTWKGT